MNIPATQEEALDRAATIIVRILQRQEAAIDQSTLKVRSTQDRAA